MSSISELKDQYGHPVWQGDTVTIKGKVIDILEDPNYINCTVKLDQQLPPSGAEIQINLNTLQVVKQGSEQPPYFRALPMTPSRLEAIKSARHAAVLRIFLDIGQCKQMMRMLAAYQNMQQNS